MIIEKRFSGIQNQDDSDFDLPAVHHRKAVNLRFVGNGILNQAENVKGNRVLFHSQPAGTCETIGAFYDGLKQRIFYFNWNSNNTHGIYILNVKTELIQILLENGSATDGDILNFDRNSPITSVDMIYGDENDGDILCFVDSLGRATKLNVDRYLNNPYPVTKRNYIDVHKAPPRMPIKCSYENDTTVPVNNLKNALYQFAYSFKYDDFEESVISSGSIVPLPYEPFGVTLDTTISNNARIGLYFSTGDIDVKSINLYGRQTKDGTTTNWFLIKNLDKSKLSIPSNTVYRFTFYNDSIYAPADLKFTSLQFDWIPNKINAQALLNGNTLIYGGVTEGYDNIQPDITASTNGNFPPYQQYSGVNFFAEQDGIDETGNSSQITIYLSGTGANDVNNNVIQLNNSQLNFNVDAINNNTNASLRFFLANNTGVTNITDIFTGLTTAALAQGWTYVGQTTNTLTLSYPSSSVTLAGSWVSPYSFAVPMLNNNVSFCYAPQSNYSFAIEYFDEKGVTNGAQYSINWDVKMLQIWSQYVPVVTFNINHRPPIWAQYYHIVRTNNLTYGKRLHWVSKGAYNSVNQQINQQFAYIQIDNMVDYNQAINASEGVVGYEFAAGDRIRFLAKFAVDGTRTEFTNQNYDYEILGTEANPIINGQIKTGNFIKIYYPTDDIGALLNFDGTDNNQNYEILLYNYIQHTSDTATNVYYECGLEFGIGNAGTNFAYHIGTLQTQSSNLLQPAQIQSAAGDYFYRFRNVPCGNSYDLNAFTYNQNTTYSTLQTLLTTPISTSRYIIKGGNHLQAGLDNSHYPTFGDDSADFQNISSTDISVHFTGTLNIRADTSSSATTSFGFYIKMINSSGNVILNQVLQQVGNIIDVRNFPIDTTFKVPAGYKAWYISWCVGQAFIGAFPFKVEIIQNANINIIEDSFSDTYAIRTNSNSRPTVINVNAKTTYFPTVARYGLAYQPSTNINQMNRFYPDQFDEYDRQFGAIMRFKVRDRILRVFQERKCGQVGIYNQFITNAQGATDLIYTQSIITSNNIQYYQGEYGIGQYPTNLASSSNADYFVDPVRGYQVRLGANGCTPISEDYKGQYYLKDLFTKYNRTWDRGNGVTAKILGFYDFFEEQYVCILQAGTIAGATPEQDEHILPYTFSFNEKRKGYCSYYTYYPDLSISAEDIIYSSQLGFWWKHDNAVLYSNFFGSQGEASLELVFNENLMAKKGWQTISEVSNVAWKCVLTTQLGQASELTRYSFKKLEGEFHAAFLRASNTTGGLINGDILKGVYLKITLSVDNPGDYVYLSGLTVRFIPSQLTTT